MLASLRTLARDGWVIGIAAGAALAYVTVKLLEALIYVVLSIVDGYPVPEDFDKNGRILGLESLFSETALPWTAVVNGHLVSFEGLFRSAILFLIVVPLVAAALHATRSQDAAAAEAPED